MIKFVQEIEGISFSEALKKLATEVGITLNFSSSGVQQLYYDFYKELHNEYVSHLHKNKIAINYLVSRGFTKHEIDTFEFGFSPINSKIPQQIAQKLNIRYLKKFGFLPNNDSFEGRLIIPIKDEYGRVIAFGGRLLGEGQPKYLNSYETDYFKKSKTLFLFDLAKEKIKSTDFAIICEGYFDAIAFHRATLNNAVATLGTAFTKFHAYKLKKLTQNVVLAFDTDSAGIKATLQSIKILITLGFNVMVASKSKEKDPDEIFKIEGQKGLFEFLKTAIPAEEFIPIAISKKYDLTNPNAISLYTNEIKQWEEVFEKNPSKLEKFKEMTSKISGNIDNKFRKPKYTIQKTGLPSLDEMIIYLFLNKPDIDIEINPKILNKYSQEFFNELRKGKNFSFENLSKDVQEYIANIFKKMEKFEIDEEYISTIKKKIKEKTIERRIKEIDNYLKQANNDEKNILLKTRMELVRELKKLGR